MGNKFKGTIRTDTKSPSTNEKKRSGLIVNITSSAPYNRTPHRAVYADYKASLAGSTKIVGQREAAFGIRAVNLEPGMHETALDNSTWTKGSDPIDALAAQALYYWWRRRFAANPKKVAEVIYKIAEREILDDAVSVGWDSRFAKFMNDNFPLWKVIFTGGYKGLHLSQVLLIKATMPPEVANGILSQMSVLQEIISKRKYWG